MNVAFALDNLGRRIDERRVPTGESGSRDLLHWAQQLDPDRVGGIEGTGSYSAWLTRFRRAASETVHEESRPNRCHRGAAAAPGHPSAALKSRTQAANLLHALLLTAPADLRAEPSQGALKDIVHRLHPAATFTQEREAANPLYGRPPVAGGTLPRRSPRT